MRNNNFQGICLVCGGWFAKYLAPWRIKKGQGKFCSPICAVYNLRNRVKRMCKVCEKKFDVKASLAKKGKGKYCSPDCKFKGQSLFLVRENSNNWRGGITNIRTTEMSTKKYKLWRKTVFERDGYRCVICGKIGGFLIGHHIKNWEPFPELRYDVSNGITVCRKCHGIVNKELPLFSIKIREVEKCC